MVDMVDMVPTHPIDAYRSHDIDGVLVEHESKKWWLGLSNANFTNEWRKEDLDGASTCNVFSCHLKDSRSH